MHPISEFGRRFDEVDEVPNASFVVGFRVLDRVYLVAAERLLVLRSSDEISGEMLAVESMRHIEILTILACSPPSLEMALLMDNMPLHRHLLFSVLAFYGSKECFHVIILITLKFDDTGCCLMRDRWLPR